MDMNLISNLSMSYRGSYVNTMAYRNEGFQRAIYIVYISDGKCLKNWEDDEAGALIDILALGTGEDESLRLVERILEGHAVQCQRYCVNIVRKQCASSERLEALLLVGRGGFKHLS